MIITSEGIMIRQPIEKLNIIGRNTQGVKLLRLDEGSTIASVTKVIQEEDPLDGEQNIEEQKTEEKKDKQNSKS